MESKDARDLFPGALEMMVLQTLRKGPLHGYALAQVIKQTSDDLLQIEEGSLQRITDSIEGAYREGGGAAWALQQPSGGARPSRDDSASATEKV